MKRRPLKNSVPIPDEELSAYFQGLSIDRIKRAIQQNDMRYRIPKTPSEQGYMRQPRGYKNNGR